MPDTPQPSSDQPAQLPVPVTRERPAFRSGGEGWLTRLKNWLGRKTTHSTRADLAEVLEESEGTSDISPAEQAMLKAILGLRGMRTEDVMVPRTDIVAVQSGITLAELLKLFEGAAHSRMVVYRDTLDQPQGLVHIRDVVAYVTQQAAPPPVVDGGDTPPKRRKTAPQRLSLKNADLNVTLSQAGIMRRILFVPPSMPAIDLLGQMQATRIHLAIVIDEYGGAEGLVSMEDIVEVIVGDIQDEHDEEVAPEIILQQDGVWLADARVSLEEVVETVGPLFVLGEEFSEVETLGGLIVTVAGRVPVRGEIIAGPLGFEFEVMDADPRKVKRLKIHSLADLPAVRAHRRTRNEGADRLSVEDESSHPAQPPRN